MKRKALITGCAGFIGSNLTDALLLSNYNVVGIDNFNDYYDPQRKEENLKLALKSSNFKLYRADVCDFEKMEQIFREEKPQVVFHLAAMAGVRPSIENPTIYTKVNGEGTINLLTLSTRLNIEKFIFGSSSSVYGNSKDIPFCEDNLCGDIISPYGASKRAAEFFVESFHHNFALKTIILRFFTVYGERGRPDMAPALFVDSVLNKKAIKRFGNGESFRDYTYVGDIVEGIIKAGEGNLDFEVINLGNNNPVKLNDFISIIEKICGVKAEIQKADIQAGDANATWANIDKAKKLLKWHPKVNLNEGLERYIKWLKKTKDIHY